MIIHLELSNLRRPARRANKSFEFLGSLHDMDPGDPFIPGRKEENSISFEGVCNTKSIMGIFA